MANNIFTGAIDSFFDKNGNWSLGVAPTQTDGNITMLDATSPNCVVRSFNSCMNFTCTGFTGSLTINSGLYLRCFGTVLTLSGTMTILGSGTLEPSNTMTITTNGTNVPYVNFTYSHFFTFTFADTFNNSTSFRSIVGSGIFNGADLYLGGNVNIASSTGGGTSTFRYTGSSGTWTCVANKSLNNNFTVAAGANLTISGSVYYGTGTLTVDPAANLVTTSSTLYLAGNCTLNTNNKLFNIVDVGAAFTITINSLLSATTLNTRNGTLTFQGTTGFTVANLVLVEALTVNRTYTLKSGLTYTVNSSGTLVGGSSGNLLFKSSIATSPAYFNLAYGATQNMRYIQATDIDSSGGQTIMAGVNSILLRTINWQLTEGNWWLVLNRA